jgi:leucyl-tRNA synthetase
VDKSKKGKIAAKATGHTYQFQIMESIGVPRAEIKKFADPLHWLTYFPPIAQVCNSLCNSRRPTDEQPIYSKITPRSDLESTGVAHL